MLDVAPLEELEDYAFALIRRESRQARVRSEPFADGHRLSGIAEDLEGDRVARAAVDAVSHHTTLHATRQSVPALPCDLGMRLWPALRM